MNETTVVEAELIERSAAGCRKANGIRARAKQLIAAPAMPPTNARITHADLGLGFSNGDGATVGAASSVWAAASRAESFCSFDGGLSQLGSVDMMRGV
jgi:hypothetical protein